MTQRVALVSGSGRGIGRAIAQAIAKGGCAVAVADMAESTETVDLITQAGGKAMFVKMDIGNTASVLAAVESVKNGLGPIDVLVNNAGFDVLKPFIATDEAFWQSIVNVNYLGNLRVTHAVLPGMLERKWGRIVNIGSDAARVGSSLESVYSGAKGAIISFSKTLAREVARKGVTVNVVCPGPTTTPGLNEAAAGNEKLFQAMTAAVPMGRLGAPEDIAAAVTFLASDQAGFITGQTLSVSGGLTMAG
ncbi:MAG: SDR family NAD(P)-dependent oxidoreductase [Smithellaceae bacterium]